MDADILRLVLFIAGVCLILGIYLWDRHKKISSRIHAIRKSRQSDQEEEVQRSIEPSLNSMDWETDHSPVEPTASESLGFSGSEQADDPDLSHAREFDELDSESIRDTIPAGAEAMHEPEPGTEEVVIDEPSMHADVTPAEQVEFSFTADDTDLSQEEIELDGVPTMILQLNVVATGVPFSGARIFEVAEEVGLVHGDMSIFHRLEGEGQAARVVYSMASMVEPGIFVPEHMSGFTTPGLALFGQLPGPNDGLAAFSDMLFTAERLAALLNGELQDEAHSALSKQTIEHIRERILEHRRQVQLALSKR